MVKISVLVPIYNVEKYLVKCLDSIRNQTLIDIEVLCINDGSTDESLKIINKYIAEDNRFKLINKANTGYGNSMNIGLEHASGDYIAIVESDDYISPDMMKTLYTVAVEHNAEVVKSDFFNMYSCDGSEDISVHGLFEDLPVNQVISPIEYPGLFIKEHSIWSAIYKRVFLESNNIRFNETPGAANQDVSFSFKVYACAKKVYLLPAAYYYYRRTNPNSSVKKRNWIRITKEVDECKDFLQGLPHNETLKQAQSRVAFKVLWEAFNNSAAPYKYAIALKAKEYLEEYQKENGVSGKIWDDDTKEKAKLLLDDPEAFLLKYSAITDDRVGKLSNNAEYILQALLKEDRIIIYGAGKIGHRLFEFLLKNDFSKGSLSFAVSDIANNPHVIDGIKVAEIQDYYPEKEYILVVVAVASVQQYEILENLREKGFKRIVVVDNHMNRYMLN